MTTQDWDSKFNTWARGPSQTEQNRCTNAESMVRDAIRTYNPLKNRSITVFAQGSYRNRTNVRSDSDVDICVLSTDTFFADYGHVPGVSNSSLGFEGATYGFDELKKDVKLALIAKFGLDNLDFSGSKAFNAKENSYRISADVVPTFEGRLYYHDYRGTLAYHSGTVLEDSETFKRINNWPEQHYANGVMRHDQTNRQFKKKARCLKNLSNFMADDGVASAKKMSSFLLESLVYNCPDSVFQQTSHYADVREVIRHLWTVTPTDESSKKLLEVNAIKYLFHASQPWDRLTVRQFLQDAWGVVGFGNS